MKWIAIYCSREWTHAWALEAENEKDADLKARDEIRKANHAGKFGTDEVDEAWGEWLEVRPMALTFLETTES